MRVHESSATRLAARSLFSATFFEGHIFVCLSRSVMFHAHVRKRSELVNNLTALEMANLKFANTFKSKCSPKLHAIIWVAVFSSYT